MIYARVAEIYIGFTAKLYDRSRITYNRKAKILSSYRQIWNLGTT
jgi:hypothetical protein